jgi:hypothetical protein
MKEGDQTDRFRPVIPNPFMGEGYANSAAKGIYVLAKQSQFEANTRLNKRTQKVGEASTRRSSPKSVLHNIEKNKTNPNLSTLGSGLNMHNKANFPFILSKMKLCKTNPIDTPRCRSGHRAGIQFVLPNEPKWNLATVKLQNKAKILRFQPKNQELQKNKAKSMPKQDRDSPSCPIWKNVKQSQIGCSNYEYTKQTQNVDDRPL